MKTVNVHDLKTNYSKYLDMVIDTGEEVVLGKYGKPVAKLVPMPHQPRKLGALKGKIWMSGDFNEPMMELWDIKQSEELTGMILLLDTNAFIWAVGDASQLGKRATADITKPTNKVYVSDISLLECAIKKRTGKLKAKINFAQIDNVLTEANIKQMAFDAWTAEQFISLPKFKWGDPFDAALIALAMAKHMTLVTSDHNILNCGIPELQTLDAKK